MRILEFILAILFPPLSVLLQTGLSFQLLLNIVLTIIGIIPGIIHALYLLLKRSPTPATV